jgi:hypothetical protein
MHVATVTDRRYEAFERDEAPEQPQGVRLVQVPPSGSERCDAVSCVRS